MSAKTKIVKGKSKTTTKIKKIPATNDTLFCIGSGIGIAILILITFKKAINNEFVAWDDDGTVYNTLLITSMNLRAIFSTFVLSCYDPLTTITYVINYLVSHPNLNPVQYHLTNVLVHSFNAAFAFLVIFKLTKNRWAACIAGIIFGIHPMNVESVAWVSERKNVLYVFFYFLALLAYFKYVERQEEKEIGFWKRKHLWFTLGLFLCSLLSKGQAVPLSATLWLIDYYRNNKNRKWNSWKIFLWEKIPFLLLSVIFVIVAIIGQSTHPSHANAWGEESKRIPVRSFLDWIFIPLYGIGSYVRKFFLPTDLCMLYPYPQKIDGMYQPMVYVHILMGLLFFAVLWKFRKNRLVVFGAGFFLANIIMILQIFPLGDAIIADRYTYLPYIGFMCMIIGIVKEYWEESVIKKLLQPGMTLVLAVYLPLLLYGTYTRIPIWQDTSSLRNDFITKYPKSEQAFNIKGLSYFPTSPGVGNADSSLFYFTKCIESEPWNTEAYLNRAMVYKNLGKFDLAISDCNKALVLSPTLFSIYENRGLAYESAGKFDLALADYRKYLRVEPARAKLHMQIGNLYFEMNRFDSARVYLNKCLRLGPDLKTESMTYFYVGQVDRLEGLTDSAIIHYDKAYNLDNSCVTALRNAKILLQSR